MPGTTKLINGAGTIKAENQIIESICGNELMEIMNNAEPAMTETSERQREIIHKKLKDRPEDFVK